MPRFCRNCGTQLGDDGRCPNCGWAAPSAFTPVETQANVAAVKPRFCRNCGTQMGSEFRNFCKNAELRSHLMAVAPIADMLSQDSRLHRWLRYSRYSQFNQSSKYNPYNRSPLPKFNRHRFKLCILSQKRKNKRLLIPERRKKG